MTRYLITLWLSLSSIIFIARASAQVSTFTIQSPQLNTDRKIWLYLPASYISHPNKKYPVIYMHDAQNLFDTKTSFAGEWEVDETLDRLKAEVIVVGIEHGDEKRINELTPFPHAKHGGGHADAYLSFIVNTLKPYIDKTYRTKSNAKNTAIWGSSLGGLVSYYAILKYPGTFGKAAVFSPSFWINPQLFDITAKAPKIKAKIYFLCGDNESEDMVTDMNNMIRHLHRNRCECLRLEQAVIIPGGQHNEKLWREGFEKAYLYLFK